MKFGSRIVTSAALVAMLCLGGCLNEIDHNSPSEDNSKVESPYVEGELMVKFTPEVEAMLATRSDLTRSGIPTVDKVLDLIGGYELERVFPINSEREELTRQSGLHLWYVVRFNGESSESVAAKLRQLGEVQAVDINRTVKRAYTGKATPLSVDKLTRAAATVDGGKMNDPLLGAQWNLINNGDLFLKDGIVKSVKDADVQVAQAWEKCVGHEDITTYR